MGNFQRFTPNGNRDAWAHTRSRAKTGPPMLEASAVSKIYSDGGGMKGSVTPVQTLVNVSIQVYPGEFVAVTGPSGCGKTTLINLLVGLDIPTGGYVYLLGNDLSKLGDREKTKLRLQHLGLVFQRHHLIPILNALENVALPRR